VTASAYTLLADEALTLDERRTTYSPAAVAIEGDSISYVGPPTRETSGTVIRLDGCVLLPGLIDVHTHTPMWLFRGLTGSGSPVACVRSKRWSGRASYAPGPSPAASS